jgi:hypothetical protein
VDFEKARLEHAGKAGLADRIEHVARIQGDGAGFDVLSFETNGTDRYIEVKTTRYGNQTPFYVTRNEVRFSNEKDRRFFLYRVFEYRNDPRMFSVRGALRKAFELSATQYRAALRAREASR